MEKNETFQTPREIFPLLEENNKCITVDKNLVKETTETNSSNPDTDQVPPDGGWGWVIVLGGFLSMLLGTFPLLCFGILFSPVLMTSGVSSTTTTWIFNLHMLIWSLFTFFIGALCDEYGWRRVAVVGGIVNSLSVLLSSFTVKAEVLFLTYSVLGGIGGSTGFTICNLAVSRYFSKRRGFALAISNLGGCVSSLFGPITIKYLLEIYGYQGSTLICSAIVLHQCVGGALLQPVEWHLKSVWHDHILDNDTSHKLIELKDINKFKSLSSEQFQTKCSLRPTLVSSTKAIEPDNRNESSESKEPISKSFRKEHKNKFQSKGISKQFKNIINSSYENLKVLQFFRVKLIVVGFSCLLLGFQNFQMWIPFHITNAGYSIEAAAWCISAASIANILGRIIISFICDRKWFDVRYGYMFGVFFTGISIIAFAFSRHIYIFYAAGCCWGLNLGIALSLHINVIIHVMGVQLLPAVLGVSFLFQGLIFIIVGPLIGLTRDKTSSYTYAVCLFGVAELVGFCAWLVMPLAIKYDQKKINKKSVNV